MPTGFFTHPAFIKHNPGSMHPERPERLVAIEDAVENSPLQEKLVFRQAPKASRADLLRVHDERFLEDVISFCQSGAYLPSMEAEVNEATLEAAYLAAGAGITAVQAVMDGELTNAFCAVRPPGHHATASQSMGFCLFNNIAIAAAYLLEKTTISRILIADWDLHHGNGTQDIFYDSRRVFYFSTHQWGIYPGSGAASQTGTGEGKGFTLNRPLMMGDGDKEIIAAFEEELEPAMEEFRPEFVLLSAGFDAHEADPLGSLRVTDAGFRRLSEIIRGIADRHAGGRFVAFLEGGYNLDVLGRCVCDFLDVFS
ncbi:histone deacetylase [bacterium]|nr:histone deacetylase [bacterium]